MCDQYSTMGHGRRVSDLRPKRATASGSSQIRRCSWRLIPRSQRWVADFGCVVFDELDDCGGRRRVRPRRSRFAKWRTPFAAAAPLGHEHRHRQSRDRGPMVKSLDCLLAADCRRAQVVSDAHQGSKSPLSKRSVAHIEAQPANQNGLVPGYRPLRGRGSNRH